MHAVFVTGAGISAPSGLGTYRGQDGLWTLHPELEAKSNADYYQYNWREMHQQWAEFRDKALAASPNIAHHSLARFQLWAYENGHRVSVVTQNVDDLHNKAVEALDADDRIKEYLLEQIYEIHGNTLQVTCMNNRRDPSLCDDDAVWRFEPGRENEVCSSCQGPLRSNVVLFGEYRPPRVMGKVFVALEKATDFVAVGTTGIIFPVNTFAGQVRERGGRTVLVNYEKWRPSNFFHRIILGDCTKTLPPLLKEMEGAADGEATGFEHQGG